MGSPRVKILDLLSSPRVSQQHPTCTSDLSRVAEAQDQHQPGDRGQIHGATARTALELALLPLNSFLSGSLSCCAGLLVPLVHVLFVGLQIRARRIVLV